LPGPDEAALVADAFSRGMPTLIGEAARQTPDLAVRLDARAVLLLPLVRQAERVGLLVVGFDTPPTASSIDGDVVEAADIFMTALELFSLRQAAELQRDVRALLEEFSNTLSATLSLAAGLDIFCHGANRLFGADRTSVWIHERRARHLVLQASSDPAGIARGTRRALGTIVFEGVRVETGGELDLLDRADELGRQLSSAVENMQLLDDVMRSRRELENTFDSISHLVAVSDTLGHIVHVNQAFALRVGHKREELLNQPLA